MITNQRPEAGDAKSYPSIDPTKSRTLFSTDPGLVTALIACLVSMLVSGVAFAFGPRFWRPVWGGVAGACLSATLAAMRVREISKDIADLDAIDNDAIGAGQLQSAEKQ